MVPEQAEALAPSFPNPSLKKKNQGIWQECCNVPAKNE